MSFSNDTELGSQSEQLIAQIGFYTPISSSNSDTNQKEIDSHFVVDRLSGESVAKLYEGIIEYKLKYAQEVEKYKRDHGITSDEDKEETNDRTFFRKQFIKLVAEQNASKDGKYRGDPTVRETNPEKATISMHSFLGKEGTELYKLALEEEMNSNEYMNAVFRSSTTHFEGEKWKQRPVVIVAGPSGSGKSFAAKAAVEKSTELLPKQEGDKSGNDVVSVDGGVIREVSQMRKLVIQAANNKGYTGISDLHSKSSILEDVKDRMREAVFVTVSPDSGLPLLGVVIPETFSSNLNPARGPKLLSDIEKLPNSKPIFCRVDGEDSTLFPKVVTYMGTRRALKTSDFPQTDDPKQPPSLDLNNTKIPESKAYGKKGFGFGQFGSKSAEKWFKKHSRDNLTMIITNDLVLKKENPEGSHNWIDANPNDKGTVLVSKRVFDSWKKGHEIFNPGDPKAVPLHDFIEHFKFGSLIKTSAEIDLAIAKKEIEIRRSIVAYDLEKAVVKYGAQHYAVAKLKEKLDHLDIILKNIEIVGTKDKESVDQLQQQIISAIDEMKENQEFAYFSKTKKALKHAVKALGKLSDELNDAEKTSQLQQGYRDKLQELRSTSPNAEKELTITEPSIRKNANP
ncbi:hypothetical protein [Legionella qingyii]|uniref:hypothetical protein n=1 Tax=Legionella qingyii TaxID=2184757 RepID=UPI0018F3A70E|nr:hypothetical protein [Legionella qingyii]